MYIYIYIYIYILAGLRSRGARGARGRTRGLVADNWGQH